MSKSDQDLIAAFLAKKPITVVPEGQGLGLSAKDWKEATRTPKSESRFTREGQERLDFQQMQDAERRHERGREESGYYKS